jgi:hypothetical protein
MDKTSEKWIKKVDKTSEKWIKKWIKHPKNGYKSD